MDCINSKFPSFLRLEASGDSEDGYDRADISCMALQEDDDDDDDAESCSYDTWDITCADKYIDDDDGGDGDGGHVDCVDSGGSDGHDDYGNNGNGGDAGCTYWMMGVPDIELESSPSIEKEEEEEDVEAATRGALDNMEDKEFWEACLATGYS